ncbi:MAG: S1 RNA-binding domain-containing protein [Myxococcales bacterium]|nr:S1 RNA-binding domain-containing protein [Myxococcales bacterium]
MPKPRPLDGASGVSTEPPRPPPAPEKKQSAQPTFEEILAQARPETSPPPERKSRPPRPKEDRKMPIVVRKPVLGSAPAAPSPATGDRPPATGQEASLPAESVFAQPTPEENVDFAAMFAEVEQQKPGKMRPGQKVTARIAHLGGEVAFLDLGGKGEGIIDLRELRNDKGDLLVHPGETIEGYVLSIAEGNVVVTRSVPKGAGREVLQNALDSMIPVEGLVTGVNKGGLEVDLGGMRAFVPTSQIDVRFVEDTAQFVGQRIKFRVTELRGGNAILSRRALLEEERAAKAAELRKSLAVGAQLEGTVTSVRDFGAFVDLGGIEGLVHVSEMSHARVAHAQDVVKAGQKVRVQVLRIEKEERSSAPRRAEAAGRSIGDEKGQERIALSMRALEQDPWDAARPQLREGVKLTGKVARLQPFGAFVELFPGVDGLVHVSALSDRHVQHPREVVKEGETIQVVVESIDDAQRRVALRRVTDEGEAVSRPAPAAPGKRVKVGDMVDATVDKCEAFGVFVHWDGGKGLIPNAELGTPRGSDNKKTLPPGTQFKAQIIEIDDRGRYRLSRTSADRAADRDDYREYQRKSAKMAPGKGFGTLGDLLRAKLAEQEEAESDEE